MKTKFTILTAVGLLAMSVASCGKNQEVAAEKPHVVNGARVGQVSMSPVEEYYEATGTARSKTATVLSSKIMGTVISLRARAGDQRREIGAGRRRSQSAVGRFDLRPLPVVVRAKIRQPARIR